MDFKRIVKYLSSNIILQVINVLLSFLSVKYLSLSNLGKYNLAKSLGGSFQYANVGLRYSLDRKLPLGQPFYNRRQFQVCFLVQALVSLLLMIVYLVLYGLEQVYIVYSIGGAIFAMFSLLRIYYRGIGETNLFIRSTLWGSLLSIVLPIIGLYFWNIYGLIWGYLLGALAGFVIFINKDIFLNFYFKPSIKYLLSFFKIGIPFFLTNMMLFMADNLDKFIINHYLNIEAVGEYAVITLVYTLSLMLPSTIMEMIFPEYIRNKKNGQFPHIFKRHVLISVAFILIFIISSYFILPFVINIFFHKYVYLLGSMRILLFALVPYILISPIYAVLFAFDKRNQIVKANLITLVLYFLFMSYFLSNHYGLLYVIYCKIIYSSVYGVFLLGILWRENLLQLVMKAQPKKT